MLTRPATPPRNVTVTPGDGEVLVQWSPPADLGIDDFVPDFMFYLVERAPSPDGPWTGLVMVLNRTSVVRPGLTNGEPYWTRVRLMVGTVKLPTYGEWSEPAGAIVGAPTEPNALGWSRRRHGGADAAAAGDGCRLAGDRLPRRARRVR